MKTTQRIRRSQAQWRDIFAQFETSRMSAAAFCKERGISYGTFVRWRQRVVSATRETAQASVDDWLPIQVTADAEASNGTPQDWEIELALPGGIQLRMRAR